MTLWPFRFAVALVVVCLGLFGAGFLRPPVQRAARLKRRFTVLSRLGKAEGEAELRDRVEALAERFPGKTYVWYLEWLVTDLERAKR
jgi:hypothetical protein